MEGLTAWCVCCGDKAQVFCSCTSPETVLCEDCVAEHLTSYPQLHFPQSLNPSPQVKKTKTPVQVPQPAFQLASVTEDSLCFFNFVTNAWRERVALEEKIQVCWNSTWVVLADGSILCCGGYDGQALQVWRCVYILSGSGSVQRRADMSVPRFAHGVVAMEQRVYVFGGCKS